MPFDEGLHDLCQEHGINVIYLFNVQPPVCRPGEEETRVGVLFADPKKAEAAAAVQPILLRALGDVFGADRIGVTFLQQAGPLLQNQGIRGRLMYLADDAQRAEFEERVVRDYADFAFEMRLFDEDAAGEERGGQGQD